MRSYIVVHEERSAKLPALLSSQRVHTFIFSCALGPVSRLVHQFLSGKDFGATSSDQRDAVRGLLSTAKGSPCVSKHTEVERALINSAEQDLNAVHDELLQLYGQFPDTYLGKPDFALVAGQDAVFVTALEWCQSCPWSQDDLASSHCPSHGNGQDGC